jgi:hypothetical protein
MYTQSDFVLAKGWISGMMYVYRICTFLSTIFTTVSRHYLWYNKQTIIQGLPFKI